jgi:predicted small metal-binding protein
VIDCACGTTIAAPNDEELERRVRAHMEEDHPGDEMSDEELTDLVARRAYDASDA